MIDTGYIDDQLDILRRAAEAGLTSAYEDAYSVGEFVDTFQHLLDEIGRTKKHINGRRILV